VQFPIRTAALDDVDGLEANVVDDMLAEFAQAEALSMIQNNDQAAQSGTNPTVALTVCVVWISTLALTLPTLVVQPLLLLLH